MGLIRLRGGTDAEWTSADPILQARECGVTTDTGMMKVGNGVDVWSDLPWVDGPTAGVTRQTVTYTTGSLAQWGTTTGTVTIKRGFQVLSVATDAAARVRLYASTTYRTADASRPIGIDPEGDHGLIAEFVTGAGLLSLTASPVPSGYSMADSQSCPLAVERLAAGSGTVAVTFVVMKIEE